MAGEPARPGLVLRADHHPGLRGGRGARLRHRGAAVRFRRGSGCSGVYGLSEKAATFQESYAQYGHWVILLKG